MNLLLLHGALGSRHQLELLADAAPTRHIRILEFSGHGEQPRPEEGLHFDHFIKDIDRALDAAGWEGAHLFGFSMGGYAALLFASRFPERVQSVVTLGTKMKWDREGLERELRLLDPQKMKEKVPHFAMQLIEQHGPNRWEGLVRDTAMIITGHTDRPFLTPDVLRGIATPAMLCVGDRDRTAVPEHTLEAARLMPKGSTLVLPATRHPFDDADLNVLLAHLKPFWGLEIDH